MSQLVVVFTSNEVERKAVAKALMSAGLRPEDDFRSADGHVSYASASGRVVLVLTDEGGPATIKTVTSVLGSPEMRPLSAALFVGTAAAVKDVKVGDVVVADSTGFWETDQSEPRAEDSDPSLGTTGRKTPTQPCSQVFIAWASEMAHRGELFVGQISSAHRLIKRSDDELLKKIKTEFPRSIAYDMESGPFCYAATDFPVIQIGVVRGIMDEFDDRDLATKEQNKQIASERAAKVAVELLEKWIAKKIAETDSTPIAPPEVKRLVERFLSNRDQYESAAYNEATARTQFIDPFFKALGWDVDNSEGDTEDIKDVIYEDSVETRDGRKAPDYGFRIGGTKKFFVEAKRPSINVKESAKAAYQVRRYAWSAKLPISILTDFAELAVYDTRVLPKPGDHAAIARLLYFTVEEYVTRWPEIWNLLSRGKVRQGSLSQFEKKQLRGSISVDKAFLGEIESWRELLAANIVLRNAEIGQAELNFAVQQTIDRIIFLRICEDRGIEAYGELSGTLKGKVIYDDLLRLFQRADDRYNSGLFHFQNEKGREQDRDSLTPSLKIDNKVFKAILPRLYYPESPYEFKVLPADILGQVYEQFLGKSITMASDRGIVVEEKPEVKKAGGVVYTPTSVVDYIVEHTVGTMLRELQTIENVSGSAKGSHALRILDPACGSGTFLLAAYQRLLDWYLRYYRLDPLPWSRKRPARLRQNGENQEWVLTVAERRRILVKHIYGVDIDLQAVEVTKLSLLLKVLEGESGDTMGQTRELFQERALPDLDRNIRSGNSLVGADYESHRPSRLTYDLNEDLLISAFDWQSEFSEVFGRPDGGFDVVIGNPPYVLLQDGVRDDDQIAYFRGKYDVAAYKLDLYHLFVEKSFKLTRSDGLCSMITPANYLTNNYLDGFRRFMLERSGIEHITVIGEGVFSGRSVDTAIFVARVGRPTEGELCVTHVESGISGDWTPTSEVRLDVAQILKSESLLFTGSGDAQRDLMWKQLEACSTTLGEIASVNFGKQLRDRKKFVTDVVQVGTLDDVVPPHRPCYTGFNVSRYSVTWSGLACLDDPEARSGGCWDGDKQNATDKILTKQIGRYPDFGLDRLGFQCLNTMFMINTHNKKMYSAEFLLGYLNSTVVRAYWIDHFFDQRRTFPKIKGTYLKLLRVPLLDDSQEDRKWHDTIATQAKRLTDLHVDLDKATIAPTKARARSAILAAQGTIDRLVFDRLNWGTEEIQSISRACEE
jgi:nucleoside phosphorylase/predicted type IV restriction endonuclease